MLQVSNLTQSRADNLMEPQRSHAIYAALSIKEATAKYGNDPVALAGGTELLNCIDKGVWDCIPVNQVPIKPIPSKLFLTPKHDTTGVFKLLKWRIVGGGGDTGRIQHYLRMLRRPLLRST